MMSAGQGQVGTTSTFCAQRQNRPLSVCSRLVGCVSLILLFSITGCARFPAIDPNGQSIFLPYPAATELTLPQIHGGNGNPGIIPQDAYPTPLTPPPCIDGSCNEPGGIHNLFQAKKKKHAIANHFAKKDPGQCGEIQLSPLRIVAPVNGEVLLLAGICGKDGYLLKREPLEWMLAPGSVGQFIEVGDDAKGKLCSSFRSGPKVEKLDVDFARGRTSNKATLLTKGTPGCDDDLEVAEGQTWLSISSPNEGVSRVTVLAPDSELWDKRRQTATIYWVDSQANFPEPVRMGTAREETLTTRVTSAENRKPATGWKVRYTIVDPNIIGFVRSDGQLEAPGIPYVIDVNENGMASVKVRARGPVGVSPVHVEVIRPIQLAENLPELNLHQADTFVTVSAPGLDLIVNGPQSASVGDTVDYVAILGNPGDLNAENASLRFVAPVGTTLVSFQPADARQAPDALLWEHGMLPANQKIEFFVKLRLDQPGPIALQFEGNAVGLTKRVTFPLNVVAPSVSVSMVRVPADTTGQAEVGQIVYYNVAVRNTGTSALVNLKLHMEASVGWREASENSNTVDHVIAMLQPGQVIELPLALRVLQEGQHQAVVTIKSNTDQVLQTSPPVGLTGVQPRPKQPGVEATIRMEPENQTVVGQPTLGIFTVRNSGDTPLENLNVNIKFDKMLEAREVDRGNVSLVRMVPGDNTALTWRPVRLFPNEIAQLKVLFLPKEATANANLAMSIEGGANANASGRIAIVESSSGSVLPPGANNSAPGNVPAQRAGNWQVSFESMQNPTIVGNQVTFILGVKNAQNLQDSNVRIQLALPEGLELNGIQRDGLPVAATQGERGVYTLPVERFMRPNEVRQFFIIVTPRIVQEANLRIAVSSDGQPKPQVESRSLTVNPRP